MKFKLHILFFKNVYKLIRKDFKCGLQFCFKKSMFFKIFRMFLFTSTIDEMIRWIHSTMYNNKIYLGLWRFGGGGESSTAMSESLSSLLTVVVSCGRGSIGGPGGSLWIEAWGDQIGGWLRGVSLMLRGLPKGLPRGLPSGLPRGLCSFCGFSSFLISSSDTSSWWRLLMQKNQIFISDFLYHSQTWW